MEGAYCGDDADRLPFFGEGLRQRALPRQKSPENIVGMLLPAGRGEGANGSFEAPAAFFRGFPVDPDTEALPTGNKAEATSVGSEGEGSLQRNFFLQPRDGFGSQRRPEDHSDNAGLQDLLCFIITATRATETKTRV